MVSRGKWAGFFGFGKRHPGPCIFQGRYGVSFSAMVEEAVDGVWDGRLRGGDEAIVCLMLREAVYALGDAREVVSRPVRVCETGIDAVCGE